MKSFLKYPLIFLISFAVTGSIVYYAITLFTQSAQEIILPELRGKNIIYVLETLTRQGLNAKLYGTQYDETIPRYAVISQDPMPGTTIKKGRDVIIYISKGKKENIIPDLRQLDLAKAVIAIEKNEFKKGHVSYTFSENSEPNHVIAQYPKPFSSTVKGSACNLLVSLGAKPHVYMMPDYLGSLVNPAAQDIENRHLQLYQIKSQWDVTKIPGQVLSQEPLFGSPVTRNDKITLTVNHSDQNRIMNPEKLNQTVLLRFSISPGFLKSHVRVETDFFGPIFDLYNNFLAPGEDVNLLIPSGKKASVNIYIDNQLENTITIDPWNQEASTGDISWDLLPLHFYPQTFQNLGLN